MHPNTFSTEQEAFWSGSFGDSYTDRNDGKTMVRSNLLFWGNVLRRTGPISSCFEIGCNKGLNLDAIKTLLADCKTLGIEINSNAAMECANKGHEVFEGSILAPPPEARTNKIAELSVAAGVLIHINPDRLDDAYKLLYSSSNKYILLSEYFNPSPVAIPYRGHNERLFKRDFAGELWSKYPSLKLVDYGFVWSKDPVAPLDDTTWFLFEKSA